MAIRVVLCDDHALIRAGIRSLLEPEESILVVGEATNAGDAVEQAGRLLPDVLVLDIVMPGRNGLTAIPDIRIASPGTRVLVLSMQDGPRYVSQAFDAGGDGYLLKEAADVDLVRAIHDVAGGQRYLHPSLATRVAEQALRPLGPLGEALSSREREVLRLLALGHTNHEIASTLFLSIRTAESDRARIMAKLALHTRAELVRYALDSGALRTEAQPERQLD